MRLENFYPSQYLKVSDLNSEDVALTIKNLESKEFENGVKPVLWFEEIEKGLILNRTNFSSIAKLHGDDSEGWIGKRISLFATEVSFRGTPTMAIRVRLKVPQLEDAGDVVPF